MLGASKKVFLPTKNLCFFLLWFLPWNCSVALLQVVISALPTIIKRHFTIDIQNYIIGTIYLLHRFFFVNIINAKSPLISGITIIGVILDAIVCYLGRDLKLYEEEPFMTTSPSTKKIIESEETEKTDS